MDDSTFFQQCKTLAGDSTSETSWTEDAMPGFFQRFP